MLLKNRKNQSTSHTCFNKQAKGRKTKVACKGHKLKGSQAAYKGRRRGRAENRHRQGQESKPRDNIERRPPQQKIKHEEKSIAQQA